jgi:hypothetical protein
LRILGHPKAADPRIVGQEKCMRDSMYDARQLVKSLAERDGLLAIERSLRSFHGITASVGSLCGRSDPLGDISPGKISVVPRRNRQHVLR